MTNVDFKKTQIICINSDCETDIYINVEPLPKGVSFKEALVEYVYGRPHTLIDKAYKEDGYRFENCFTFISHGLNLTYLPDDVNQTIIVHY